MIREEQFLTIKELAITLRKHVTYVYAMRHRGFKMPGRVAKLSAAIVWLEQNPSPRSRSRKVGH